MNAGFAAFIAKKKGASTPTKTPTKTTMKMKTCPTCGQKC